MQRRRGRRRRDKRPAVAPGCERPVGRLDIRRCVRQREPQHRMRQDILSLMPFEIEAVGAYPLLEREQSSARIHRAGRSMLSINPINSSIPSSAINWAHGVRRRPNPALTEGSTEQESTRWTASSGAPGQILVDCWLVDKRKLVQDPNPTGVRPIENEMRRFARRPGRVESYFFFLAFFDPPSIERLASTSFRAD